MKSDIQGTFPSRSGLTIVAYVFEGGNPPYAIANFDSNLKRVPCLSGTRVDILDNIDQWIKYRMQCNQSHTTIPDSMVNSGIFWISGMAGSGKTTIAFTVASGCRDQGILGASFFCSRDNADCSNPMLVFNTIAYQLGQFCPAFKDELDKVLISQPNVVFSGVSYQLEKQLVEPLQVLGDKFPPSVVVIDALDECKDDNATSIILSSLSLHIAKLSPLQFLITSRPDRKVTSAFQTQNLSRTTQPLALHEVKLDVVERDIQHYFGRELSRVQVQDHLKESWPSPADVETLTKMSSGLFIFAATAVKFIESGDPMDQLANLLKRVVLADSSPLQCLDELYLQVLNNAFPYPEQYAGQLKQVLGAVALLQDPLSTNQLEDLLSCNVHSILQRLQSVVIVPKDGNDVVYLIHPSFFDFITSKTRCSQQQFLVNSQMQHTLLAQSCLKMMKQLKRDICNIRDPTKLNHEVQDLSARMLKYVSPCLLYACKHWALHLSHSMFSNKLLDLLEEFCLNHLLHWIEVCSLLGDLHHALLALNSVQKFLSVCFIIYYFFQSVSSWLFFKGEQS